MDQRLQKFLRGVASDLHYLRISQWWDQCRIQNLTIQNVAYEKQIHELENMMADQKSIYDALNLELAENEKEMAKLRLQLEELESKFKADKAEQERRDKQCCGILRLFKKICCCSQAVNSDEEEDEDFYYGQKDE